MITITRSISFDAGHRVWGHEGKCARLHGHRYCAEITVQAPELDSVGRIVDFGVIKNLIGSWIAANWDHRMILFPEDPIVPIIGEAENPYLMKYGNPTAENMAYELLEKVKEILEAQDYKVEVIQVRLYETPTCFADCFVDVLNEHNPPEETQGPRTMWG